MGSFSLYHVIIGVAVFMLVAVAAGPLVRANIWLYRKLGWTGFASVWERQRAWWVPAVRGICVFAAAVFVAMGLRNGGAR